MATEIVIANFLRTAKDDHDGAQALAAVKNRNAIYLCEQAAEKIVIAFLTSEGIQNTKNHQLSDKIDALPDINPMKVELRKIEYLQAFATTYRYPTPGGKIPKAPSADALKKSMDEVSMLLNKTSTCFGVDLSLPDTPAKNIGPIR